MTTLPSGLTLNHDKYRLERFIAQGGFGCTYLARHLALDIPLAIKECFPTNFCHRLDDNITVAPQKGKEDTFHRLLDKFRAEARSIAMLHHSGIVRVIDSFDENGTVYLVMYHIDGITLLDMVKQNGVMPEHIAVNFISQIAKALGFAHSQGLLHLDVKPSNIMVDKVGRAVLIDFGSARQFGKHRTSNVKSPHTVVTKTPGYAPPEQMIGDADTFTPATDIYALGATLYYLLTGQKPPSAPDRAAGSASLILPPHLSSRTREAITSAMTLNLEQRTPDAESFHNILIASPPPFPVASPIPSKASNRTVAPPPSPLMPPPIPTTSSAAQPPTPPVVAPPPFHF